MDLPFIRLGQTIPLSGIRYRVTHEGFLSARYIVFCACPIVHKRPITQFVFPCPTTFCLDFA